MSRIQETLFCEARRETGRTRDTDTNFQAETEEPSKRRDTLGCPVQETLKRQVSTGVWGWGARVKTTPSRVRWSRNGEGGGKIFFLGMRET